MGRGGRGRGGGVVRRLGVGEREGGFVILVSRATGRQIECADAHATSTSDLPQVERRNMHSSIWRCAHAHSAESARNVPPTIKCVDLRHEARSLGSAGH